MDSYMGVATRGGVGVGGGAATRGGVGWWMDME